MFVIGTAGHIDHGKSSIISRLTGIDPDRLPEEKERGMTIDLGFAWYDTEKGRRIGIVDVPGHERFVRNMIAGVGGIDALILVVAADDGWMPQSQEHMQITRLLGINYGIVVISKIDLVEQNWVDLVEDDIRDKLKGTFLDGAPFVRLSSETGEGFDALKKELENLAGRLTERRDVGKPRLYIDRSFVLPGMGGVVAGTLRGGAFKVGMDVSVFPARKKGKIRIIHSHNQQVENASPGQRTAVSLTGIDKQFLKRGSVISLPGIIDAYPDDYIMALSLELLRESPVSIKDRRRLLLILGTTEVEGEVRILSGDIIKPGGQGIIFFKPFDPLISFLGDRYIVRLPTPPVTVGGGAVLDILDRFPRKKEQIGYEYLKTRVQLSPEILIKSELSKKSAISAEGDFIFNNFSAVDINKIIDEQLKQSSLVEHSGILYQADVLDQMIDNILDFIKTYLNDYPHTNGLGADKISHYLRQAVSSIEPILQLMTKRTLLMKKGNLYDLPDRTLSIRGELKHIADELEGVLLETGFSPPSIKDLIGSEKNKKEAFDYLLLSGRVVKIAQNLAFHRERWQAVLDIVRSMLAEDETLTVATLREKLDNSRKYSLPILEETDRLKITERQGDIRVKGDRFEKDQDIL